MSRFAAWQHVEAREGFEVVFIDGQRFEGETAAVEDGEAWAVRYAIELGADWATRRARVSGLAAAGRVELEVEADGAGRWQVNGDPAPHLAACLDVDLESSSLTNAFPVRRYHYASPAFGFECELAYDESGLVLDYPGIAVRAGLT